MYAKVDTRSIEFDDDRDVKDIVAAAIRDGYKDIVIGMVIESISVERFVREFTSDEILRAMDREDIEGFISEEK